ncbi:hypothetical protein M9H77_23545 [Catharanthus roseus]|uniref:Uncharacterized protein n=1 Tax=Catharanthus roseus TaxID=4058 RepID=A0ACC0AUV3_CATRO|nr:hypothetical protein M9H77_23545 [Catharanthus roseus]
MDGTFDQLDPLDRMKHHRGYAASVDLQSATDRWPLLLLFKVMCALFDRSFASALVNATLATNIFTIDFVKKKPSFVSFLVAEQVYPGVKFTDYEILGDDLVIFDRAAIEKYMELFKTKLQIGISVSKSIFGVLEFTKRFREGDIDMSPFSIKRILAAYQPLGWFCASSRPILSRRHGRHALRYEIFLLYGRLQYELLLARVFRRWIILEVFIGVIQYLRDFMVPKDIVLPPNEVFPYEGMRDFNEYSLYYSWMDQYLIYLKWYCQVVLDPCVTIDQITSDPPIYIRTWYMPEVDLSMFRYGIMFWVIDMVGCLLNTGIKFFPLNQTP